MKKFVRNCVSAMIVVAFLAGFFLAGRASSARMPTALPQTEIDALVALYNATDGTYWTEDTNWLTDADPCDWYGVACGSHNWPQMHVIWLKLPNNNLNGQIPPEIVNLVELDELLLNDNHLSGPIPAALGNFGYLVNLCLQNNQLSEPIPPAIGSIGLLSENGGLRIFLENNRLTGEIPSELGNLPRLRYLNLSRNQLTGSIPESLGNLSSKLWEIDLSFNKLEGPIPASLSSLTQLRKFKASDNQLTGEIPVWLGGQPYLKELELQHNQLTGKIPKELSGSPFLELVYFAYNRLSGELPAELGVLANLKHFWLTSNFLEGQLPETLTNLQPLAFWYDTTNLCEPCTEEYQSWLRTIPDLKRTGSCDPKLTLSQNIVGPGGSIEVTGMCWPSNMQLGVYLNEVLMGTIQSDPYGSFSFEARVDPNCQYFGWYWLSVKRVETSAVNEQKVYCHQNISEGGPEAAAGFKIEPDAPAWPSQGSPVIFAVPEGIVYDHLLYLPMLQGLGRPLTISLGDPVAPDSLDLQEGGDADTLPITAGSPPVAARRTGSGEILGSSDSNQIADSYMQFDAANQIILVGIPTQNIIIEVEYLDLGYDNFVLQYDALSGGPFEDGRFKDTQMITKTNTGQWRTARFAIDDVYFADRIHGGDFRIDDCRDGYEIIRKVTIDLVQ